ncbi:MAG: hypothetical protein QOK15_2408 [Nocardioidaceae bacterium]|nr:hypothetical protein [Nocardioidaceae bacterium]
MILEVGGTGQLGGRVVRLLREQGRPVRCLLLPQSDDAELRRLGVDVVRGDLSDGGTLPAACAGVDTVVATATVMSRRLAGGGGPSIHDVDQDGMSALTDAAERAGVQRFVHVSFAGIDSALGSPLDQAKMATEKRLSRSPMRTVVVRPDAFQEIHLGPMGRFDIARGKVSVIGRGNTKRRWVATDDVARLIVAVSVEPDPPRLVEFGGPDAISRNEAIALAERAMGRSLKRQHLPRAVARLGMRVLARRNDALASVFGAGLAQDLVEARWDDKPLRDRGITPRSASEFIEEQARARR